MPTVREQIAEITRTPGIRKDKGAQQLLRELHAILHENPLLGFEPHPGRIVDGVARRPQKEFIEADTRVVAAFAGNQFGKSTVLTVCALRECLPREVLPPLLSSTKRFEPQPGNAVHGWILCPSEDKIFDSFQPAFEEWTPKSMFFRGSWGRAFNGTRLQLTFKNGSSITFKTYKQDPSTLGGARLHFVGYDEPPPRKHREESRMRLSRYGGYEMFAMTPLDANTTYVRRAVWKQREHPDITVVRGSIHDNPTLDSKTVEATLGDLSDLWRRAREYGDFVDVGGLIYPDFDRCVQPESFDPAFVRSLDVVVGIDPGIRNAGIVWVGFDSEQVAHVFAELLLQNQTPQEWVRAIKTVNHMWGVKPAYVVDPAAKQRSQANGMTVLSALNEAGVYPSLGQNDHELGFGQMRTRMHHGRFKVSPDCRGLRDEADDYAAKEPGEHDDDSYLEPVSSQFHRLDALRYAVLERFWDPVMERTAPDRNLGGKFIERGFAVPARYLHGPSGPVAPMGNMS